MLDKFKGLAQCLVVSGSSCFFWLDVWDNHILNVEFPHLFSFLKNQSTSVKQMAQSQDFSEHFHLPLSEEAFVQFQQASQLLSNLQIQDGADTWSYIWGSSIFSTKKAYIHLTGAPQVHPIFSWLWKSCCQNKRKLFFWLCIQDRLSTRNLLRHRNMHLDDFSCALGHLYPAEETVSHLFLDCPFAQVCWASLHLQVTSSEIIEAVSSFRLQLHLPFAMEIIITMSWSIWMVRNDLIFRGIQPSLSRCKHIFRKEFAQVILRAKASYKPFISQWLGNFV